MNAPPDVDLRPIVTASVIETLLSVFSLKLERVETEPDADPDDQRCSLSIGFTGDAAGAIGLNLGRELVRAMAAHKLGVGPEEVEDPAQIEPVLGELGKAVGDSLISTLAENGLRCAFSTPSLDVGGDFRADPPHSEDCERFVFRCAGQTVLLEMGLELSGPATAAGPNSDELYAGVDEADSTQKQAAAAGASPNAASLPWLEFKSAGPEHPPAAPSDFDLELLLDIPVELTVELGRTKMPINELLKLQPGSAVKLSELQGDPVDILANDVLIARGEVVVRNEKYGIRITEITSRAERLKGLK